MKKRYLLNKTAAVLGSVILGIGMPGGVLAADLFSSQEAASFEDDDLAGGEDADWDSIEDEMNTSLSEVGSADMLFSDGSEEKETASAAEEATASAEVTDDAAEKTDGTEAEDGEAVYVLMNIPYMQFYESDSEIAVDAASSASLNKPRTGTLAGGSYHTAADSVETAGVIYPVKVADPSKLEGLTQVTDESKVSITTTNRGQTATTLYEGKDALFESPDYSYYVLAETPAAYKTWNADGTFGAVEGVTARTVEGVTASVNIGANHADIEIALSGTEGIETGQAVSGIVLTASDGSIYGLRHINNIWRATEFGWNVKDNDLAGKTITNIRYYTQDAVIDYPVSITTNAPIYALMNIPYDKFYEAELGEGAPAVDGVSSSTMSKPRAGTLAGGSYHVNSDGSDITGVIYPVIISDPAMLEGKKQVTDADSVTITVTLRGQENTTTYTGKDALFESESYSYYLLPEKPVKYKKLNADGSFSAVNGRSMTIEGAAAEVSASDHSHADVEIRLTLPEGGIAQGQPVSGVIVTTEDGSRTALRHIANIWRATEIGGNVGETDFIGKTITNVRYYTQEAVIDYPLSVYAHVHEWSAAGTVTKKPTAQEDGERTFTCAVCGAQKVTAIPRAINRCRTAVSVSKGTVRVTFDAVEGADEYQVAYRKQGDTAWKKVKTGGQTSYTVTGLEKGGAYEFRVRPLRSAHEGYAYGIYTGISRRWLVYAKASLKAGTGRIAANVFSGEAADEYKVWYSASEDLKDAKTQVSAAREFAVEELDPGVYYLRIRPYRIIDGKKYAGALSRIRIRTVK